MKFSKTVRTIYSLTTLAVALAMVTTIWSGWMVPPAVPDLPGRSGALMAPEIHSVYDDGYAIAEATDGGYVSTELPQHRLSMSLVMRTAIERAIFGQDIIAAHSPKLSNVAANAAADAIGALMNSGDLKLYNGSQAATADTAISGQTLCATLTFSSTAFGAASAGVATANTITSDTDADADCSPTTWYRALKSDHSTIVMDGSVGTSGADINLATATIVQHATVAVSSLTITMPKS